MNDITDFVWSVKTTDNQYLKQITCLLSEISGSVPPNCRQPLLFSYAYLGRSVQGPKIGTPPEKPRPFTNLKNRPHDTLPFQIS